MIAVVAFVCYCLILAYFWWHSRFGNNVMPGRIHLKPASKFKNIPALIDGIRFASMREAKHYLLLKAQESKGEIEDLRIQPRFSLDVNGQRIGTYRADFSYYIGHKYFVEDVKGVKTEVYKLKKKLMKAIHDIEIMEI